MSAGGSFGNLELLGLAWSFGWRIAAGVVVGYYLDLWLSTTPLFTLVFAIAALVAGVRGILGALAERRDQDDGDAGADRQ